MQSDRLFIEKQQSIQIRALYTMKLEAADSSKNS